MRAEPFATKLVNVRIKRDWRPYISDHAVLRYIERAHGVDIDQLRSALVTEAMRAAIVYGAGTVKGSHGTWVLSKEGRVVTMLSPEMRSKRQNVKSSKRAERQMLEAHA